MSKSEHEPIGGLVMKNIRAMRLLERRDKALDIIGVLNGMASIRGLPKPYKAAHYLGLLIEEADFSLECDILTKLDHVGTHTPQNSFKWIDTHKRVATELHDAASAARYSADLWELAAHVREIGIEPEYTWEEAPVE